MSRIYTRIIPFRSTSWINELITVSALILGASKAIFFVTSSEACSRGESPENPGDANGLMDAPSPPPTGTGRSRSPR